MLIVTTAVTIGMATFDTVLYSEIRRDGKPVVLRRYLAFYITYLLMSLYHYQFWCLGSCILKRFKKLNAYLEIKNANNITHFTESKPSLESLSKNNNTENKTICYIIDKLNKKNEVLRVQSKSQNSKQ